MEPFLAEVRIYGFDFAPRGWAFCDGQRMMIRQNTALYNILQIRYGGDGIQTYHLPDLQGRVAIGAGQYEGDIVYPIGSTGGAERVTITMNELRAHTHLLRCHVPPADTNLPAGNVMARASIGGVNPYVAPGSAIVDMDKEAISKAGGDQDHNNMQPFIALRYCIALTGIVPPRP